MTEEKKPWINRHPILAIFLALVIVPTIFAGFIPTQNTTEPDFNQLAVERFNKIALEVPELDSITCEGDSCRSVAYLNFNTVPDDLEIIVRGNAATFSKFKNDNNTGNRATIIATYNGDQLMSCNAADGVVTECN
jgi:hypothetical protein